MRVLIIGAGILGASAAYHLARLGAQVEIIDQNHPGKATLAGAGVVCPWATEADDPDWYLLYARGARYYGTLIEELRGQGETELGYSRVGALVLAEDRARLDTIEGRISRRIKDAPEAGTVRRLGAGEAKRLFPPLRDDLEAIHIPGGARVDGRLLAASMLRVAISSGATLRNDYVSLRLNDGRAECLGSDGRPIPADEIIVTAGAWAAQILALLGLRHPVVPQKGQIIHLHLPGVATSGWPVVLPMNSYYMLAFDDSRVVVGATREDGSGFDYRVTARGQLEVLQAGLGIAPGLADATHIETRVGFRPAGSAMRPILGRVPQIAGLTIGNGLGASGLTVGPFAGHLLAGVVMGEPAEVPLERYSPTGPEAG
ncbi:MULTISPECIES: iminodiacetate oxidase IdaA [Chelativorans]|uniref:FAD dependent oxidoreductase n=2 Tax=Alphaproteobacteria TaxID=28211 RepID=Q11HA4_CHESB|nr:MULTISPECIES: iminodiacetate oxidase IdaA [Chelativorans]AAG09254.1 iminodiacetate oxidase [EDTA-degrading bacterium BNC1]